MIDQILNEEVTERAVLVGLISNQQNEAKAREYLDELAFLADTAGAVTVKTFLQKLEYPNPRTYVGKGKLEEIRAYIEDNDIGMAIFDDDLSSKQVVNIERELKVKILDRTSLILDIFAKRARTANAKTHTVLREACVLSHAVVSSKLLVNRLPCRAQGTAAVTTPCFRQHIRGDSASTYTLCAPTSRHRQRRIPRPLSYNGALRRQIPHRHFSRFVGCTDSFISFISALTVMSSRTKPLLPMMA